MNIVAIMGSPHRGNSYDLVERIEEKLVAYGDVEFEYIHLKDANLEPCKGCFNCFIRGADRCPLRDDGPVIAQKLAAADGVILVSPVYSMHVSYLLKRFIDRLAYNFHRPPFWGQRGLVVAVAGNIGLKPTLKYMKEVATGWGFDCIGQLGYVAVPKHTPMRVLMPRKDRTDQVVERFYRAIANNAPRKLGFMDYLGFRLMQASYARLEAMSPVDYAYWRDKGWLDRGTRFFCDNVRWNPILDLPARLAGWMVGRQVDRALAKAE